jgi:CRP-like cAMP-binding protein
MRKPKSTVLFRCGEEAFGMFVIFSGKVSIDFGVDSPQALTYGAGALLGVPATLTRSKYTMTATVTEDAELGFCSPEGLESVLHDRPDICRELLTILAKRMAEISEVPKALLKDKEHLPHSGVL